MYLYMYEYVCVCRAANNGPASAKAGWNYEIAGSKIWEKAGWNIEFFSLALSLVVCYKGLNLTGDHFSSVFSLIN